MHRWAFAISFKQSFTMLAEFEIQSNDLKKAALLYRAINHKLRQEIILLLHRNGTLTVTAIYEKLKLEQSVCSQQLAVLRRAGLVVAKRKSKQIFYSVNYHRVSQLHMCAERLLY